MWLDRRYAVEANGTRAPFERPQEANRGALLGMKGVLRGGRASQISVRTDAATLDSSTAKGVFHMENSLGLPPAGQASSPTRKSVRIDTDRGLAGRIRRFPYGKRDYLDPAEPAISATSHSAQAPVQSSRCSARRFPHGKRRGTQAA